MSETVPEGISETIPEGMNKNEFIRILEYDINRLDCSIAGFDAKINSLESNIYFVVFSFVITLGIGQFASNDTFVDLLPHLFVFIIALLLIFILACVIRTLLLIPIYNTMKNRTQPREPIVKGYSQIEVITRSKLNPERNIEVLAKFMRNVSYFYLFFSVLTIILVILTSSSTLFSMISIEGYFIFFDINKSFFYCLFILTTCLVAILVLISLSDKIANSLIKLPMLKSKNTNKEKVETFESKPSTLYVLISFLLVMTFYLIFLSPQLLIIYFNRAFIGYVFTSYPLLSLAISIIVVALIVLSGNYVSRKYKQEGVIIKQERYREIRRRLIEESEPDFDFLWEEYKINSPW